MGEKGKKRITEGSPKFTFLGTPVPRSSTAKPPVYPAVLRARINEVFLSSFIAASLQLGARCSFAKRNPGKKNRLEVFLRRAGKSGYYSLLV